MKLSTVLMIVALGIFGYATFAIGGIAAALIIASWFLGACFTLAAKMEMRAEMIADMEKRLK